MDSDWTIQRWLPPCQLYEINTQLFSTITSRCTQLLVVITTMWTRNTGVNLDSSKVFWVLLRALLYNLVHVTYGLTSQPKDEAIMVKCLAREHKCHDRPGWDSYAHADNTTTWARCTGLLSMTLHYLKFFVKHLVKVFLLDFYLATYPVLKEVTLVE